MSLFAANNAYASIIEGLRGLSYSGSLLAENYIFPDWFAPFKPDRQAAAVAFGQTPTSYDTALIGVARANGLHGPKLIDQYRALGAPFIVEVSAEGVREWAVARQEGQHALIATYAAPNVRQLFVDRAREWKPENLLRAKNIGSFRWTQQLSLFAGLVPELEEQIQESLDPLLRDTLSRTKEAYEASAGRKSDPAQLFKLVFWLLTAKVFRDRGVPGFLLPDPDPDELLAAVARQHRTDVPKLLNRQAREAAAQLVWNTLDFRNLSVEVLSQIWASTLVDDNTKTRLGIHRTSRTIVRYIMDRIPFDHAGDDRKIILEPCCGSGVFLVGAMNALRPNLFGSTPGERHDYFVKHLAGIEKDPFGAEISRLSLTLADFPNPNNWDIAHGDVFDADVLKPFIRRAGVVLCNPPFRDFDKAERRHYQFASPKTPVELLNRVLDDLHPSGVLGFVLPRAFVDGRGYSRIRQRIAERFANIDLTVLPDSAFEADPEVALLVATEPIPHDRSALVYSRVYDDKKTKAWSAFEHSHEVSFRNHTEVKADSAARLLAVPELADVWDFLVNHRQLGEVAEIHRGLEWNEPLTEKGKETGNRKKFVHSSPATGFSPGVAPRTKFSVFEHPETFFLNVRPGDQRGNAYEYPWERPKAILNKSTRSRGRWRLAAFADREGLTCYQTYTGVWPLASRGFDEVLLAAVLNSPVANAFVSTREGKTDNTMETLAEIPVPFFTPEEAAHVRQLVNEYQSAKNSKLLMEIDAAVLDGYRMPPRLERKVLDWFHNQDRPTPVHFDEYPTWGRDVFFSLSFHLSGKFEDATAGALLNRMAL